MLDLLTDVLKRAKERGATEADAFLMENRAFSAQVRLGRVDTVKHAREQHLSLRVFSGKSAAAASTSASVAAFASEIIRSTLRPGTDVCRLRS